MKKGRIAATTAATIITASSILSLSAHAYIMQDKYSYGVLTNEISLSAAGINAFTGDLEFETSGGHSFQVTKTPPKEYETHGTKYTLDFGENGITSEDLGNLTIRFPATDGMVLDECVYFKINGYYTRCADNTSINYLDYTTQKINGKKTPENNMSATIQNQLDEGNGYFYGQSIIKGFNYGADGVYGTDIANTLEQNKFAVRPNTITLNSKSGGTTTTVEIYISSIVFRIYDRSANYTELQGNGDITDGNESGTPDPKPPSDADGCYCPDYSPKLDAILQKLQEISDKMTNGQGGSVISPETEKQLQNTNNALQESVDQLNTSDPETDAEVNSAIDGLLDQGNQALDQAVIPNDYKIDGGFDSEGAQFVDIIGKIFNHAIWLWFPLLVCSIISAFIFGKGG